jgi:hypothetical protein
MGSWNGTCMISNLPIPYGAPVRFFILERTDDYEQHLAGAGFCYYNSVFRPIAYPITGRYDDYGSVAHIEDSETIVLIETYFKELAKSGRLFNSDSKSHVAEEDVNMEFILNRIERSYLWHVKKRFGSKDSVFASAMVLESVYQLALETLLNQPMDYDGDICSTVIDNKITEFISATNENHSKSPEKFRMPNIFSGFSDEHANLKFWYGSMIETLTDPAAVIEDRESKLISVVAKTKEFMGINWFLSKTRRSWMPTSGHGSQDGTAYVGFKIYDDFCAGLLKITNAQTEEYKKDYDYEQEQDKLE